MPDSLEAQYKGLGIALAATQGGTLVALVYVRDLAPEIPDEVEGARAALDHPKVLAAARALEEGFGHVHIGMASCWEFCEL